MVSTALPAGGGIPRQAAGEQRAPSTIDVLGVYLALQTLGLHSLLVIAALVFVLMSRRKKSAGSG